MAPKKCAFLPLLVIVVSVAFGRLTLYFWLCLTELSFQQSFGQTSSEIFYLLFVSKEEVPAWYFAVRPFFACPKQSSRSIFKTEGFVRTNSSARVWNFLGLIENVDNIWVLTIIYTIYSDKNWLNYADVAVTSNIKLPKMPDCLNKTFLNNKSVVWVVS